MMTGHLKVELKQRKPFASIEQEVVLNILRTASALREGTAAVLRDYDLSGPQYNVLRILRGAGDEGLPCSEIGERLVSRDPDVTRLLDRLEKQGLTGRARSSTDRRMVIARLTKKGLDLVNSLDAPVAQVHVTQLGHMKRKHLKTLIGLLEFAREG